MEKKNIKNYTFKKSEEIQDLSGIGYLYEHDKTGARVVVLSNEDENKSFAIGFRTLPEDSTGVAHIIEHSVLGGSKKYPVKDAFTEIQKGSLNTFVNAFTFPDKTMYPFATTNEQDFLNLMDVYMDLVLNPSIYEQLELFWREGWHYEYDKEADKLNYTGIVYNEMRGAFSSPMSTLYRDISHGMFPDTCYGVESGGDPKNIPDLTYEYYLGFHKKYYHPSNSFIVLYGDLDYEKVMDYMDVNFLSKFDKIDVAVDWNKHFQPSFGCVREKVKVYPATAEQVEKGGTYLAYSFVLKRTNLLEILAMKILGELMFSVPGAPIREALTKAGIGSEYSGQVETSMLQPSFSIVAIDAKKGQKDDFLRIIKEEVEKLVKNGISKNALLSLIATYEFSRREGDFGRMPKGIQYSIDIFDNWLYDDNDPFTTLDIVKYFDELKKGVENHYFEDLLEKYFINSEHGLLIELNPNAELAEKEEKERADKLESIKKSMTQKDLEDILANMERLQKFNDTADTPEQLATIPHLTKDAIKREVKKYKINDKGDYTELELPSNGILYFNFNYALQNISREELPYLGILLSALQKLSTENYSYKELNEKINLEVGGIGIRQSSYHYRKQRNEFIPTIQVNMKTLTKNVKAALEITDELLTRTLFTDDTRLLEILNENLAMMEFSLTNNTFSFAMGRAFGNLSAEANLSEWVSGSEFHYFMRDLVPNFESRKEELKSKLEDIYSRIFKNNTCITTVTASREDLDAYAKEGKKILDSVFEKNQIKVLPEEDWYKASEVLVKLRNDLTKKESVQEGFIAPGQVQYVIRGGHYIQDGEKSSLIWRLIRNIFGLTYLYEEIRVKGGAYGAFTIPSGVNGTVLFASYRDPNLEKTNAVYEGIPAYLESFDISEEELGQFVITTIGDIDTPASVSSDSLSVIYGQVLCKVPDESRQNNRDELLDVTCAKIRELAKITQKILDEKNMVVIGTKENIERNKDMFSSVKNI
ncbi:MAG: insulinase family protein [Lachnospiraceae bacterium]|nr:insulinase family protein [Lachnospiraceae bacterium]